MNRKPAHHHPDEINHPFEMIVNLFYCTKTFFPLWFCDLKTRRATVNTRLRWRCQLIIVSIAATADHVEITAIANTNK